ncbi:MAG: hypothetical protein F6K31_30445 [Symploca sp. SIO2G7]|nr:hypothetical protein [Symploca sp. SIO2G7]
MKQAYDDGALSGETISDAYRIEEEIVDGGLTTGITKKKVRVFVRFVSTLEEIEVELINVDVLPA